MERIVHHLNFFKRLLIIPVYLLLRLWYLTLRVKMDSQTQQLMKSAQNRVCVFYFWHHNLFAAPMLRKLRKNRYIYGLMSASKDGAWLEALVKWFGVEAIRGSSSWRGKTALNELEQRKNFVCDIIITPDGPKGPCCRCKPGSIKWALMHNFEIIGLCFSMNRFWSLRSWDRFKIPVPFSTISIQAIQLNDVTDSDNAIATLNELL